MWRDQILKNAGDQIVRNVLSIGVATAVYAVSFGVLSVAAGFSIAQTCVMSLVCFTGASQLTFTSVIAAGGGVAGALPPALLLAGRNALYAFSLKGVVSGTAPKRALRAQLVVDETTAMAHAQPTLAAKRRAFDLTALCLFTAWNLGTLAGAIAGRGLRALVARDRGRPRAGSADRRPGVRHRTAVRARLAQGSVRDRRARRRGDRRAASARRVSR